MQEDLARAAGMSLRTLSAIECGTREPTLISIFRLAEALSIEPSVLIARMEEQMVKLCPTHKK